MKYWQTAYQQKKCHNFRLLFIALFSFYFLSLPIRYPSSRLLWQCSPRLSAPTCRYSLPFHLLYSSPISLSLTSLHFFSLFSPSLLDLLPRILPLYFFLFTSSSSSSLIPLHLFLFTYSSLLLPLYFFLFLFTYSSSPLPLPLFLFTSSSSLIPLKFTCWIILTKFSTCLILTLTLTLTGILILIVVRGIQSC